MRLRRRKKSPPPPPPPPPSSLQFNDQWNDLKPQPIVPRFSCGLTLWGSDKLVVVGGYNVADEKEVLDTIEIFDIPSRTWSTFETNMTEARINCTSIVVNDQLYIFGGYCDGKYLNNFEVIDLCSREMYKKLSTFPHVVGGDPDGEDYLGPPSRATALQYGSMIYLVGGSNDNGVHRKVYVFDTLADEWSELPSMKTKRWMPTVCMMGDTLLVAGGFTYIDGGGSKSLDTVETLHLPTQKWTHQINPMPWARCQAVGFCVGTRELIIAGGLNEYGSAQPGYLSLKLKTNAKGNRIQQEWNVYDDGFPPFAEMTTAHYCPTAIDMVHTRLFQVNGDGVLKWLKFAVFDMHGVVSLVAPDDVIPSTRRRRVVPKKFRKDKKYVKSKKEEEEEEMYEQEREEDRVPLYT